MTKALIPVLGAWRRHTAYEVVAGCIRPGADARLVSVDPWAAPAASSTRGAGSLRHAHNALLSLLQHEASLASTDPSARQTAERAVTGWCAENGLLGVLLHRVSMVTVRDQAGALRHYLRDAVDEWDEIEEIPEPEPAGGIVYRRGVGGVEVPVEVQAIPVASPSVVIHGLSDGVVTREGLRTTWARFFPKVPHEEQESFAYPRPGTDAFWQLYAEPLEDFFAGVHALASAVEALGPLRTSGKGRGRGVDSSPTQRLIAPVRPMLSVSRKGVIQGWRSPSLLGTLALRAAMHLVDGGRARACLACAQLFTSALPTARYCCNRCRRRVNKRVERKNQRESHRRG